MAFRMLIHIKKAFKDVRSEIITRNFFFVITSRESYGVNCRENIMSKKLIKIFYL